MNPGLLLALIVIVVLATQPVDASTQQPTPLPQLSIGQSSPAIRTGVFRLRNIVGGQLRGMAIQGSRAYAILGAMFGVFDIANPNSPVRLGCLVLGAEASSIQLDGNMAYVLTGGYGTPASLQVIDISNASNPILVAQRALTLANHVHIAGGYLYAFSTASIDVYDLRQPDKLVLVHQFVSPNASWYGTRQVILSDGRLYVIVYSELIVLDASALPQLRIAGRYQNPTGQFMRAIAVGGTFAYVEDVIGVRVVNVADTAHMAGVGFWQTSSMELSDGVTAELQGNRLFVLREGFFTVLDVSNPVSPSPTQQTTVAYGSYNDGIPGGFTLQNGRLYFWYASHGLWSLDLVNLPSGQAAAPAPLTPPVYLSTMVGRGNYLYATPLFASTIARAAQVVDVTDPINPRVDNYLSYVPQAFHGAYGYGRDFGWTFNVFSMADPLVPRIIGTQALTSAMGSFVVTGTVAYVTQPPSGCSRGCFIPGTSQVIDLSDATRPVLVHTSADLWHPVAALGKYLYGRGNNGLRILNVSDPTTPIEVGVYTDPRVSSGFYSMQVHGEYGYIYGAGGLGIVDLSDPARPQPLGIVPIRAWQLIVNEPRAYVLNESGLYVIDVSNPRVPRAMGSLLAPAHRYRNMVLGPNDMLLVAGTNLFVYDLLEVEVFPQAHLPFLSDGLLPRP
jgi:hypothetical protein